MATFQPKRLVQARHVRQVSARDLAEVLEVSPKTISAYEHDRNAPSQAMAEAIARHLQFPVSFFYNASATFNTNPNTVYFRSLRSSSASDRERMTTLGDLFHELMEQVGRMIPLRPSDVPRADDADRTWDLTAHESPARSPALIEEIALWVRRSWGQGDGPIPDLVRLLEAHGIWVHILRKEAANIDAFSYRVDGRANIVLNHAKGDPYRSRFDAAHELGHLVMHEGPEGKEREKEANIFASAFLLPKSTWSKVAPRSTNPWHYVPLKRQWRVSVACMLYRSSTLGLLKPNEFTSAMVQYSQLGWRSAGEPLVEGAPYEVPVLFGLCVQSLGERTIGRLLNEMCLPSDVARDILPIDMTPAPPSYPAPVLRLVK